MNSIRRPSKTAMLAVIAFTLTVATTAAGQSQPFSLYSASDTIFTNTLPALTNNEPAINAVLPVIEMTNVPLSQGIIRLLRQSKMNASINSELIDWWAMADAHGHDIHQPMLNFRWTNLTASDALFRVLREHHLTMDVEPVSLRSEIKYTNDFIASKDVGFFDPVTNVTPIQLDHVPIRAALKNLARAAGLNYMLDTYIKYYYRHGVREPLLTLKLTNCTADQVFRAVCLTHKLDVVDDPQTTVALVRWPGHDVNFVDADFYAIDTNTVPLIQLKNVPISTALKDLARQGGFQCIISPQIDTGHTEREADITLRWQNITDAQAFAAICESYDLGVTRYPVSGFVRVEPNY